MAPCCRLTNVAHMGDLKEQDFEAVWNGEAFTQLRALMLKGEYPSYCHSRCNYRVEMKPQPSAQTPGRLKQGQRKGDAAGEGLLAIEQLQGA